MNVVITPGRCLRLVTQPRCHRYVVVVAFPGLTLHRSPSWYLYGNCMLKGESTAYVVALFSCLFVVLF